MKFLILFAVAAVFGSVHGGDQECFRAIFKECVREPVPKERMTLCDEVQFEVDCIYKKAHECKMSFWHYALFVSSYIKSACALKSFFDQDLPCYSRALNDSVCVAPIDEAMKDIKTNEDLIRANKKICNLFDTYSDCVQENVEKNCHTTDFAPLLFNLIVKSYQGLSNGLCEQLILPADEKDSRPDNFGFLNVFASLGVIFASN